MLGNIWELIMPNRFIKQELLDEDSFADCNTKRKLLTFVVLLKCDSLGLFKFGSYLSRAVGAEVTKEDILNCGVKIIEYQTNKFFVVNFTKYQYKNIGSTGKADISYRKLLKELDLEKYIDISIIEPPSKGVGTGFQGGSNPPNIKNNININTNTNKNSSKINVSTDEDLYKIEFEKARKLYKGSKRGLDTEFANFKKKYVDYKNIVYLLIESINKEIEYKRKLIDNKQFCPQWKNLSTWIDNRCWEQEFSEIILTNNNGAKNGNTKPSTDFERRRDPNRAIEFEESCRAYYPERAL